MELITYKTNIQNEKAARKVASKLNPVVGAANWQLDIQGATSLLTVFSPGCINKQEVKAAIRNAGYKATSVENIYSLY